MVRTVKKFLGSHPEMAVDKLHLPSACRKEGRIALVVTRIFFRHAPTRDCCRRHLQLYRFTRQTIQAVHINFRLARHSFDARTECDILPIGRNFRVVCRNIRLYFLVGHLAYRIVNMYQATRNIVPEYKTRKRPPEKILQGVGARQQ